MARSCGDVDRGVVVLTEIVLERLEPADERLPRSVVQQAAETLEEIPQPLRILAEVVDLLGRCVGTDQAAALDQLGVGAGDALGHDLPERPFRVDARTLVERRLSPPRRRGGHQVGGLGGFAGCASSVSCADSLRALEQDMHRLERRHDVVGESVGVGRSS